MGRKAISSSVVIKRYKAQGLIPLDNYVDNSTPIQHKCIEAGHIGISQPSRIFNGGGCKECHIESQKIPIEEVHARYRERGLILLDNYIDSKTPASHKCIKAGHINKTQPMCIFSGSGCWDCAIENSKINQKEAEERYKKQGLIMLEPYIDNRTEITHKCIKSGHVNKTTPMIIFAGHGCKECASDEMRYTLKEIDEILSNENRTLERYGDWSNYTNTNDKMFWRCLACHHIWQTIVGGVLHSKTNCPACSKQAERLTIPIIKERLTSDKRSIEVYGDYDFIQKATDKINWRCLECNHIWGASPNNILNHGRDCPKCNMNKGEYIVFECLEIASVEFEFQKALYEIKDVNNTYHIDFYMKNINTIIEYNGRQHYEPVRFGGISIEIAAATFTSYQQPRDEYVKEFCINNNIHLIIIDGREFEGQNNKLKQYMVEIIIPKLKGK